MVRAVHHELLAFCHRLQQGVARFVHDPAFGAAVIRQSRPAPGRAQPLGHLPQRFGRARQPRAPPIQDQLITCSNAMCRFDSTLGISDDAVDQKIQCTCESGTDMYPKRNLCSVVFIYANLRIGIVPERDGEGTIYVRNIYGMCCGI